MDVVLPLSDCEPIRDGLVVQPVNTLTAVAYLLAAAWVWRAVGDAEAGGLLRFHAAAVAAVGVGSVLYHGPAVVGAEAVHTASLVLVGAAVGANAVVAWRRRAAAPGRAGWVAAAALIVAVPFQVWGRTGGPLCAGGTVHAHGIWHVATAVALGAFGVAVGRMTGPGR